DDFGHGGPPAQRGFEPTVPPATAHGLAARPEYGLDSGMRLTDRVRSISYLKAHAAELLRELVDSQEPLVITQNGEAKAVVLDVATYDQLLETSALLKLLSLADRQAEEGMLEAATDAIANYRLEG